jgi:hypothetical protein
MQTCNLASFMTIIIIIIIVNTNRQSPHCIMFIHEYMLHPRYLLFIIIIIWVR